MNIKFTLAAAASLIATTLPAQIAPLQVTANTNIVISGLLSVGIKDSQVSQGNAAVNPDAQIQSVPVPEPVLPLLLTFIAIGSGRRRDRFVIKLLA